MLPSMYMTTGAGAAALVGDGTTLGYGMAGDGDGTTGAGEVTAGAGTILGAGIDLAGVDLDLAMPVSMEVLDPIMVLVSEIITVMDFMEEEGSTIEA